MKHVFLTALTAASLGALVTASPAMAQLTQTGPDDATVIGAGTGGTATFYFDGNSGGVPISGLTSTLTLTYTGLSGGDYTFSYLLENTSSIASRVSGFAFNTDPDVVGGDAAGLFEDLLTFNQPGGTSYPNGVGNVEVCLTDGGACQGGGSGGVLMGDDGTGTFSLDFGLTTPTTITLSDFFVRYQSLLVGTGSGTGSTVTNVPEPATWAMMLIGFGAVGYSMRRRRKVLQQFA